MTIRKQQLSISPIDFRNLFFICVTTFFVFFGFQMLIPILPLYAEEIGASKTEIGLIIGFFPLTAAPTRPFFGNLMDKSRKKPFLIFGLVIFFFSPILYLFCKTPLQLIYVRIFHALGVVSYTPAGLALSSETTTKRKGEALGWYGTAVMMGAALGPAIGGYLLSYFDYESVFIVSAISSLVVILPSYALIQEEKYQKPIEERKIEKQPKIGQVIFNKMMLGACVALFTLTVVYGVLLSIFPVSARNKGFTPVQIGMFFSLYALTAVILRVIVGKISDRIGRTAVVIPGMIISICIFLNSEHK